jgi:hypothetical protein
MLRRLLLYPLSYEAGNRCKDIKHLLPDPYLALIREISKISELLLEQFISAILLEINRLIIFH